MKEAVPSTLKQSAISRIDRGHGCPRITRFLFMPVLAPMIQDRRIIRVLMGMAALQVWLTAMGLPGWQCPIRSLLGVPCPGCGLSTAMALLLQGQWGEAMSVHAFASVFLLGFVIITIVGMLPAHLHRETIRRIAWLEQRTGFTVLLLTGMVVYWVLRLFGLFCP
jgi:hypothetical protein